MSKVGPCFEVVGAAKEHVDAEQKPRNHEEEQCDVSADEELIGFSVVEPVFNRLAWICILERCHLWLSTRMGMPLESRETKGKKEKGEAERREEGEEREKRGGRERGRGKRLEPRVTASYEVVSFDAAQRPGYGLSRRDHASKSNAFKSVSKAKPSLPRARSARGIRNAAHSFRLKLSSHALSAAECHSNE